jgi:phosphate transport system substrate-binding protein
LPTLPWAVVPLIGLLFGTAVLFWFWRNNTPPPTTTRKPSPNISTIAATQLEAAPTNSTAASLQTYNSLREVQVPKGIFNYASAIPFAPLHAPKITNTLAQAHPKFHLRYTEPPVGQSPSAGISITMLLNGDVSFAQSSRPL